MLHISGVTLAVIGTALTLALAIAIIVLVALPRVRDDVPEFDPADEETVLEVSRRTVAAAAEARRRAGDVREWVLENRTSLRRTIPAPRDSEGREEPALRG